MRKLFEFIKRYKYIILALLLITVVGQKLLSNDNPQSSTSYTTAETKRGNISKSVSASGSIESANYLAVTTSVNGIVKKVYVQEGDTVSKGQKIMDITLNLDGEESFASAYSSYLSAKSSLDRAKAELLSKESALINAENSFDDEKERNSYQSEEERESFKIAENTYLVAKSDYDRQSDAIRQAEVALNKAWLSYQAQSPSIVAPDTGIIANIVVVEGMDISNSLSERTSSTVASIRKEGTPIATFNIGEMDINSLKVGQKTIMELDSIENRKFMGAVVGIDKIGVSSNGVSNYPVIVKFEEESDLVLPNMGVEAEIIIGEREDVLLVPSAAVQTRNKNKYVTVERGGYSEDVTVETGISDNKNTEVLTGLNEGDVVMVPSLPTEGFTNTSGQGGMGGGGGIPGVGGFMVR